MAMTMLRGDGVGISDDGGYMVVLTLVLADASAITMT